MLYLLRNFIGDKTLKQGQETLPSSPCRNERDADIVYRLYDKLRILLLREEESGNLFSEEQEAEIAYFKAELEKGTSLYQIIYDIKDSENKYPLMLKLIKNDSIICRLYNHITPTQAASCLSDFAPKNSCLESMLNSLRVLCAMDSNELVQKMKRDKAEIFVTTATASTATASTAYKADYLDIRKSSCKNSIGSDQEFIKALEKAPFSKEVDLFSRYAVMMMEGVPLDPRTELIEIFCFLAGKSSETKKPRLRLSPADQEGILAIKKKMVALAYPCTHDEEDVSDESIEAEAKRSRVSP